MLLVKIIPDGKDSRREQQFFAEVSVLDSKRYIVVSSCKLTGILTKTQWLPLLYSLLEELENRHGEEQSH